MGLLSLPIYAQENAPVGMQKIPAGAYIPLYAKNNEKTKVPSFFMDKYPATNSDYLQFVKENEQWRKNKIKKIFSENGYLQHWTDDLSIGSKDLLNRPVTHISWFAALAYCESKGKSLPTVDQWEYVASVNIKDPNVKKKLIEWYSRPTEKILAPVGSTFKNKYGIYDIYGLIWEWTLDFNTAMITGESRGDSAIDKNLYCGAGASGTSDFKDYAAFMRFAFRSSLKASYSTSNLGFRCVK